MSREDLNPQEYEADRSKWNVKELAKIQIILMYIVTLPFFAWLIYFASIPIFETISGEATLFRSLEVSLFLALFTVPISYLFGFFPALFTGLIVAWASNFKNLTFVASVVPIMLMCLLILLSGLSDHILPSGMHSYSMLQFMTAGCGGAVFSWWITRRLQRKVISV